MNNSLPNGFTFSQSSLQNFVDCRRWFWLRHVENASWPPPATAFQAEQEARMRRGKEFHKLIQRYINGVPEPILTASISGADMDIELYTWWQRFLSRFGEQIPELRYAETGLTGSLAGWRLMALYDLVVLKPDGSIDIYDWKTSEHKPKRQKLANKLQTKVYLWLIASRGRDLFPQWSGDVNSIRMSYWFADTQPEFETFTNSSEQFYNDGVYLSGLIQTATTLTKADFQPADEVGPCHYCPYPSYCNREIVLTDEQEEQETQEDTSTLNFDFNDIVMIEL
jgi:hypothetical protein